ncbi:hypothetical protein BC833DRAFT_596252 [Globomyces pollinis-pini]|nr:hypothetical protein BC833DRAFT_596252 [Globomyces pollinis-pini]KAJ2996597.1 hypothetical protein HDV02_006359 [Globomyces sp. JEL0801]
MDIESLQATQLDSFFQIKVRSNTIKEYFISRTINEFQTFHAAYELHLSKSYPITRGVIMLMHQNILIPPFYLVVTQTDQNKRLALLNSYLEQLLALPHEIGRTKLFEQFFCPWSKDTKLAKIDTDIPSKSKILISPRTSSRTSNGFNSLPRPSRKNSMDKALPPTPSSNSIIEPKHTLNSVSSQPSLRNKPTYEEFVSDLAQRMGVSMDKVELNDDKTILVNNNTTESVLNNDRDTVLVDTHETAVDKIESHIRDTVIAETSDFNCLESLSEKDSHKLRLKKSAERVSGDSKPIPPSLSTGKLVFSSSTEESIGTSFTDNLGPSSSKKPNKLVIPPRQDSRNYVHSASSAHSTSSQTRPLLTTGAPVLDKYGNPSIAMPASTIKKGRSDFALEVKKVRIKSIESSDQFLDDFLEEYTLPSNSEFTSKVSAINIPSPSNSNAMSARSPEEERKENVNTLIKATLRRKPNGQLRSPTSGTPTSAPLTDSSDSPPNVSRIVNRDSPRLFRVHSIATSESSEVSTHFVNIRVMISNGPSEITTKLIKVSKSVDFTTLKNQLGMASVENISYRNSDFQIVSLKNDHDWSICLDQALIDGKLSLFVTLS